MSVLDVLFGVCAGAIVIAAAIYFAVRPYLIVPPKKTWLPPTSENHERFPETAYFLTDHDHHTPFQ